MDEVEIALQRARRRLFCQRAVSAAIDSALLALGLVLAISALRVLVGASFLTAWLMVLGAIVAAGGAAFALWRWFPSLPNVARILDRAGQTRDRFITALRLKAPETDFEKEARRECLAYLDGFQIGKHLPFRFPSRLVWLLVPIASLALLGTYQQAASRLSPDQVEGLQTTEARAQEMRQLAQALEHRPDPDSQRFAEELRRAAERLKETAEKTRPDATDAEKNALRELSRLENMAEALKQSRSAAQELTALQQALQRQEPTRPAAESMQRGNLAEAASRLERTAETATNPELDAIARELAEAARQLADKTSSRPEMQKQMAEGAKGGQATASALRSLAQSLRSSKGDSQSRQNSSPSEQSLRQLMAALQQLKSGNSQGNGQQQNPEGSPGGAVLVKENSKGGDMSNPGEIPSGQPGSEHDVGTTKTPFGKPEVKEAKAGTTEQLSGQLGEGESLQQMITAAGDDPKAQRRYKDLFQAVAGDAEQSVEQEDIPLSTRFYVKRYFEAIRPKE